MNSDYVHGDELGHMDGCMSMDWMTDRAVRSCEANKLRRRKKKGGAWQKKQGRKVERRSCYGGAPASEYLIIIGYGQGWVTPFRESLEKIYFSLSSWRRFRIFHTRKVVIVSFVFI